MGYYLLETIHPYAMMKAGQDDSNNLAWLLSVHDSGVLDHVMAQSHQRQRASSTPAGLSADLWG